MPGSTDPYVLARRVLLDALDVLGAQRDAITMVGAQAVYLRVGEADIAVAPTTTDADLSLDPAIVKEQPALDEMMRQGGFLRREDSGGKPMVGIWEKTQGTVVVSVDLLMPAAVAPAGGRRAATIPGHEKGSVLKVPGIEASLVDSDAMPVDSLEANDKRAFEIQVAGQGALLVAKIHKILDRETQGDRLKDKDALDVFRLLRGTSTEEMAGRIAQASADDRSRTVTSQALDAMPILFGRAEGEGVRMAIRATEGLMLEAEVVESLVALTVDLITAV
jgi:hypothetical protein